MKHYSKILLLLIIPVLFGGCDGSNEVYKPVITPVDTLVSDTTQTIELTPATTSYKKLTIDLSSIENAPDPTSVVVRIKMQDGEIISYSVTTEGKAPVKHEDDYIIQKGDTPSGLARKFGVPEASIVKPLLKGQKLRFHE